LFFKYSFCFQNKLSLIRNSVVLFQFSPLKIIFSPTAHRWEN
jgi:hypothetical protein